MSATGLEPFLLERYFAAHEFDVQYLLGSSDCESMTTRELLALRPGATEDLLDQRLGYTEPRGAPALRSEIAGLYETIAADDVLVHGGAQEAIYAFMRAVLRPGDRVVVQFPAYQSLESVARIQGCSVARWRPASAGPPWHWRLDDLERLAAPGLRAVIVNGPHNPTGYLMPEATFRDVAHLADAHGAVLFSDEVYRWLEFDVPRLPAACDLSPRAVSLGSVSKSLGLPGLRLGWIATRDADLLASVWRYKDYLTICNSAPSEFLVTLALAQREKILASTRALLERNRALVDGFFRAHAARFGWSLPAAGPIAYVRVEHDRAQDLCARALERGLMMVPSTQFDDGDAHVRIGFGRRNLAQALARFDEVLA